MSVPVVGRTPGRRYGHTIIFCKPYLLVFGGNTGTESVNDVWCLNVDKAPFTWDPLKIAGAEAPCIRAYHSASLCTTGSASGMMVTFGGRTSDQSALKDTWGLRRHRDGRWDWVRAPYKVGSEEPLARYQHSTIFVGTLMIVLGGRTNTVGENVQLEVYETESSEWRKFNSLQRFRHTIWAIDSVIFMHGGFENETPNIPTNTIMKLDLLALFKSVPVLVTKLEQSLGAMKKRGAGNASDISTEGTDGKRTPPMQSLARENNKIRMDKVEFETQPGAGATTMKALNKYTEEKRLGNQAAANTGSQNNDRIYNLFLAHLLKPREWSAQQDGNGYFSFRRELIIALADEAQRILMDQPMVLRVDAPIKVFGDIHGQYQDLMRFFDLWGIPNDQGDIESYDYLFLGDYVDRGAHSLETICLLMALKVKFPDKIHLLRGNHEDKWINNAFGFAEECSSRLGEDPNDPDSVFTKINDLFDWLPLAAVIDDKIVCIHGGIGSTLNTLDQIEQIQRPLEVIHEVSTAEQQLVVDILWSDPTDSDQDLGIQPNFIRDPNGTGNIVKFGPDRVRNFLDTNKTKYILRAHECVMDGFERFAGGQLFTVFSATDYCGRHKNAGAMLQITKQYELVPKMIYPLNNPEQNWLTDKDDKRPPTPPKWAPQGQRKSSYE